MADKPQFYKEFQWVQGVDGAERQLIGIKTKLTMIKSQLEAIKAEVDAEGDSTADMITLANQANSLVNNVKYTDLITFLENNLG